MTKTFDELNEQERIHNLFIQYIGKSDNGLSRKEALTALEGAISNKYSALQLKYINWLASHDELQKSIIQEMLVVESVFNDMKDGLNFEKKKSFIIYRLNVAN